MTGRSHDQAEVRHDDTLASLSTPFMTHKGRLQPRPRPFVHHKAVFVRHQATFSRAAIRFMQHKEASWSR